MSDQNVNLPGWSQIDVQVVLAVLDEAIHGGIENVNLLFICAG